MGGDKDKDKDKKKANANSETVRVVVRVRPLSKMEINDKRSSIVEMIPSIGQCRLTQIRDGGQEKLYDETARPIVEAVLEGFNGTIFAYGQTGTGKTYTMTGPDDYNDIDRGIIPRAFDHVMGSISVARENTEFLVRVSFLEIYNEEVRDLLGKDPKEKKELKERPDIGVYVRNLESFVVKSVEEMNHVMKVGNRNRSTGATAMNERSSRSHSIFTITIEQSIIAKGQQMLRMGKLHLVDLAGSERQSKTHSEGQRFREATKINLSLSALGNVISALVDRKKDHIPYRDSKLTRLLQDSLGGNARTVMVANLGPAEYNFEETLSTLRYADRAKRIQNKPKINEDPKDAMLREFQDEIERLKQQLAEAAAGGGGVITLPDGTTQTVYVQDPVYEEMKAKIEEERKALLAQKDVVSSEKQKMEAELAKRKQQLEEEKMKSEAEAAQERKQLESQLKQMEEKVMHGGVNLLDKTEAQEAELRRQAAQLQERERREAQIKAEMEEKELITMNLTEKYNSLQDEVDDKTKKLRKLFSKLQETKAEVEDLVAEHQREKDDLVDDLREISRELERKMLIIDSFIPPEEARLLDELIVWDEEEDRWKLPAVSLIGNKQKAKRHPISAMGARRPLSSYSLVSIASCVPDQSLGCENILRKLDLEESQRTTSDYTGPRVGNTVQASLDAVLEYRENDVDVELARAPVEALPNVLRKYEDGHNHNHIGSSGAGVVGKKEREREGSSRRRDPTRQRLAGDGIGRSASTRAPRSRRDTAPGNVSRERRALSQDRADPAESSASASAYPSAKKKINVHYA